MTMHDDRTMFRKIFNIRVQGILSEVRLIVLDRHGAASLIDKDTHDAITQAGFSMAFARE